MRCFNIVQGFPRLQSRSQAVTSSLPGEEGVEEKAWKRGWCILSIANRWILLLHLIREFHCIKLIYRNLYALFSLFSYVDG